jgi:hypothetical protein
MTHPKPPNTDCIVATIIGFLLPFFLAGANGNAEVATAAIRAVIDGYSARTPEEFDLVGRIVGFSTVGMDNLRLSKTPGLSDTKVLQYRNNAVSLCRSSDNAKKMLDALQSARDVKRDVPRPSVTAAPPAPKPAPAVAIPAITHQPIGGLPNHPMDLEAMKREARTMLAAFSKVGAPVFAMPPAQTTATMVKSAVRAAIGAANRR